MVRSETRGLLERLFDVLDWESLGEVYCDEGGDAFWAEHRGPALWLGMRWADALGRRLESGGVSLYVGAGVAELPAMVAEVRDMGRRVVAVNLRAAECTALDAGLRAVGVGAGELTIRPCDVAEVIGEGPFDQIAMVSVLTDPETWPVTSGVTYGRLPPVLLDVERFVRERERIVALVDAVLGVLAERAVVTTTVDEVSWFLHAAERLDLAVETDDEAIETAIVGDPLGFLEVRRCR